MDKKCQNMRCNILVKCARRPVHLSLMEKSLDANVKKAKMQTDGEEIVRQVTNSESSTRKGDLPSDHVIARETDLSCADYISRTPSDYTSQLYPSKPYTHILSVPVAESMSTFSGQTSYTSLQQSQPYTAYSQASQTYGLPPFGALWPGIKSESGLVQAPNPTSTLTCSSGVTSSQSSPVLYSYPTQATTTNANVISSTSPVANLTVPAVASISNQQDQQQFLEEALEQDPQQQDKELETQFPEDSSRTPEQEIQDPGDSSRMPEQQQQLEQEYPTYTILGQNPFQQCYPNQNFTTATLASTAENSMVTSDFLESKSDSTSPAQPTQRPVSGDTTAGQAMMRAMGSKETEEQSKKNVTVKNRGKGKKADVSPPQHNDLERVFLWDLDETIIIFHSLLTGLYAQKYGKDPTLVVGSGLAMEEMIFEVADTHLFFNDLEECDQVHVEDVASDDNGQDLSNYSFTTDGFNSSTVNRNHPSGTGVQGGMDWMRKLAFRYRKVIEVYEKYKSNVSALLSPQRRDTLQRLRADIETLTDGWLGTALKCLLLIQSRKNCVNVLITTTQLVPALAKVLLYGLGEIFPIVNIYSATKIGKESCFERIVTKFGKKVTYVVIGDGRDEEMAAKQHTMPFWRITNHNDLISLHQALELDFL
ncbi:protein phosphatase EYA3 isoform X3 [Phyllobates terribilis]|uniref:protein phosphatase EYA3 isoform X3 n=1 Tax=Phyllobates terribilis TaxID=111132 RepID=UPI003CCB57AC